MDSWETFGHEAVKSILNSQLGSRRFVHAYLFAGPEAIGKKTLALEFAKKILASERVENHPDFQILDIEGEIGIEAVREFIAGLSFKPFLSPKKIAVINNAQNLNQQSSNALLKTLEEPSPSTIIILIANSHSLLSTIISRCQVLNFNSLSEGRLNELAKKMGIPADAKLLALSFGSAGRLKRLAENKEFLRGEELLMEQYRQICQMPVADKLLAVNRYSELENSELENNFLAWMNWQTAALADNPEDYKKLSALSASLAGLKMNKNKKMLLQSLFLQI